MAKRSRGLQQAPANATASAFREALSTAIEQLAQAGSTRAGEKPYFFPNGIQSIELTIKAPAEFSVTVSGVPAGAGQAGAEASFAQAAFAPEFLDQEVCIAPDDDEPRAAMGLGKAAASAAAPPINTQLVMPATGLYTYGSADKRFGVAKVIEAVKAIGKAWNNVHPDAPIGIGNISKNGGGPMPPHVSHQKGIDVDIRPMRKDKKPEPVAFTDPTYSRPLTQKLVNIIRDNDVLDIKLIFFNDSGVTGVQPASGHHNHLHLRFKL